VARGCLAAALLLPLLALFPAPTAGEFKPDCEAVTKAADGRYNLTFRVKCNYGVYRIEVDTTRSIERVRHRPALDRPDPEDHVRCHGSHNPRVASCAGEMGENVRLRGALRIRGNPCHALRTAFGVLGGVDCEPGQQCIRIGYAANLPPKPPRGCG